MRQRVAIARTLILSPRIILMDEPFGALDPTTRLHMQALLVELWREAQATVFFVTHSIEEAVYLGDRVYVFSSAPGTILKRDGGAAAGPAAEGDAARAGVHRARLRDPRHHRQRSRPPRGPAMTRRPTAGPPSGAPPRRRRHVRLPEGGVPLPVEPAVLPRRRRGRRADARSPPSCCRSSPPAS